MVDLLQLPVALVRGFIGRVELTIPWGNPGAQPTLVKIDQVYIVVRTQYRWTGHEKERRRRLALKLKQDKIASLESKLVQQGQGAEGASGFSAALGLSGFLEKLVTKITDNLQVHIRGVHLRWEDRVSTPGRPFAAGITLESLHLQTTDASYSPPTGKEATSSTLHTPLVHKTLFINYLSAYWNPHMVMCDAEGALVVPTSDIAAALPLGSAVAGAGGMGSAPQADFTTTAVTDNGRAFCSVRSVTSADLLRARDSTVASRRAAAVSDSILPSAGAGQASSAVSGMSDGRADPFGFFSLGPRTGIGRGLMGAAPTASTAHSAQVESTICSTSTASKADESAAKRAWDEGVATPVLTMRDANSPQLRPGVGNGQHVFREHGQDEGELHGGMVDLETCDLQTLVSLFESMVVTRAQGSFGPSGHEEPPPVAQASAGGGLFSLGWLFAPAPSAALPAPQSKPHRLDQTKPQLPAQTSERPFQREASLPKASSGAAPRQCLVLPAVSAEVRMQLSKNARDLRHPQQAVSFHMSHATLRLGRDQLQGMLQFTTSIVSSSMGNWDSGLRPRDPVRSVGPVAFLQPKGAALHHQSIRQWWRFAARHLQQRVRRRSGQLSWVELMRARLLRICYIHLYKRRLAGKAKRPKYQPAPVADAFQVWLTTLSASADRVDGGGSSPNLPTQSSHTSLQGLMLGPRPSHSSALVRHWPPVHEILREWVPQQPGPQLSPRDRRPAPPFGPKRSRSVGRGLARRQSSEEEDDECSPPQAPSTHAQSPRSHSASRSPLHASEASSRPCPPLPLSHHVLADSASQGTFWPALSPKGPHTLPSGSALHSASENAIPATSFSVSEAWVAACLLHGVGAPLEEYSEASDIENCADLHAAALAVCGVSCHLLELFALLQRHAHGSHDSTREHTDTRIDSPWLRWAAEYKSAALALQSAQHIHSLHPGEPSVGSKAPIDAAQRRVNHLLSQKLIHTAPKSTYRKLNRQEAALLNRMDEVCHEEQILAWRRSARQSLLRESAAAQHGVDGGLHSTQGTLSSPTSTSSPSQVSSFTDAGAASVLPPRKGSGSAHAAKSVDQALDAGDGATSVRSGSMREQLASTWGWLYGQGLWGGQASPSGQDEAAESQKLKRDMLTEAQRRELFVVIDYDPALMIPNYPAGYVKQELQLAVGKLSVQLLKQAHIASRHNENSPRVFSFQHLPDGGGHSQAFLQADLHSCTSLLRLRPDTFKAQVLLQDLCLWDTTGTAHQVWEPVIARKGFGRALTTVPRGTCERESPPIPGSTSGVLGDAQRMTGTSDLPVFSATLESFPRHLAGAASNVACATLPGGVPPLDPSCAGPAQAARSAVEHDSGSVRTAASSFSGVSEGPGSVSGFVSSSKVAGHQTRLQGFSRPARHERSRPVLGELSMQELGWSDPAVKQVRQPVWAKGAHLAFHVQVAPLEVVLTGVSFKALGEFCDVPLSGVSEDFEMAAAEGLRSWRERTAAKLALASSSRLITAISAHVAAPSLLWVSNVSDSQAAAFVLDLGHLEVQSVALRQNADLEGAGSALLQEITASGHVDTTQPIPTAFLESLFDHYTLSLGGVSAWLGHGPLATSQSDTLILSPVRASADVFVCVVPADAELPQVRVGINVSPLAVLFTTSQVSRLAAWAQVSRFWHARVRAASARAAADRLVEQREFESGEGVRYAVLSAGVSEGAGASLPSSPRLGQQSADFEPGSPHVAWHVDPQHEGECSDSMDSGTRQGHSVVVGTASLLSRVFDKTGPHASTVSGQGFAAEASFVTAGSGSLLSASKLGSVLLQDGPAHLRAVQQSTAIIVPLMKAQLPLVQVACVGSGMNITLQPSEYDGVPSVGALPPLLELDPLEVSFGRFRAAFLGSSQGSEGAMQLSGFQASLVHESAAPRRVCQLLEAPPCAARLESHSAGALERGPPTTLSGWQGIEHCMHAVFSEPDDAHSVVRLKHVTSAGGEMPESSVCRASRLDVGWLDVQLHDGVFDLAKHWLGCMPEDRLAELPTASPEVESSDRSLSVSLGGAKLIVDFPCCAGVEVRIGATRFQTKTGRPVGAGLLDNVASLTSQSFAIFRGAYRTQSTSRDPPFLELVGAGPGPAVAVDFSQVAVPPPVDTIESVPEVEDRVFEWFDGSEVVQGAAERSQCLIEIVKASGQPQLPGQGLGEVTCRLSRVSCWLDFQWLSAVQQAVSVQVAKLVRFAGPPSKGRQALLSIPRCSAVCDLVAVSMPKNVDSSEGTRFLTECGMAASVSHCFSPEKELQVSASCCLSRIGASILDGEESVPVLARTSATFGLVAPSITVLAPANAWARVEPVHIALDPVRLAQILSAVKVQQEGMRLQVGEQPPATSTGSSIVVFDGSIESVGISWDTLQAPSALLSCRVEKLHLKVLPSSVPSCMLPRADCELIQASMHLVQVQGAWDGDRPDVLFQAGEEDSPALRWTVSQPVFGQDARSQLSALSRSSATLARAAHTPDRPCFNVEALIGPCFGLLHVDLVQALQLSIASLPSLSIKEKPLAPVGASLGVSCSVNLVFSDVSLAKYIPPSARHQLSKLLVASFRSEIAAAVVKHTPGAWPIATIHCKFRGMQASVHPAALRGGAVEFRHAVRGLSQCLRCADAKVEVTLVPCTPVTPSAGKDWFPAADRVNWFSDAAADPFLRIAVQVCPVICQASKDEARAVLQALSALTEGAPTERSRSGFMTRGGSGHPPFNVALHLQLEHVSLNLLSENIAAFVGDEAVQLPVARVTLDKLSAAAGYMRSSNLAGVSMAVTAACALQRSSGAGLAQALKPCRTGMTFSLDTKSNNANVHVLLPKVSLDVDSFVVSTLLRGFKSESSSSHAGAQPSFIPDKIIEFLPGGRSFTPAFLFENGCGSTVFVRTFTSKASAQRVVRQLRQALWGAGSTGEVQYANNGWLCVPHGCRTALTPVMALCGESAVLPWAVFAVNTDLGGSVRQAVGSLVRLPAHDLAIFAPVPVHRAVGSHTVTSIVSGHSSTSPLRATLLAAMHPRRSIVSVLTGTTSVRNSTPWTLMLQVWCFPDEARLVWAQSIEPWGVAEVPAVVSSDWRSSDGRKPFAARVALLAEGGSGPECREVQGLLDDPATALWGIRGTGSSVLAGTTLSVALDAGCGSAEAGLMVRCESRQPPVLPRGSMPTSTLDSTSFLEAIHPVLLGKRTSPASTGGVEECASRSSVHSPHPACPCTCLATVVNAEDLSWVAPHEHGVEVGAPFALLNRSEQLLEVSVLVLPHSSLNAISSLELACAPNECALFFPRSAWRCSLQIRCCFPGCRYADVGKFVLGARHPVSQFPATGPLVAGTAARRGVVMPFSCGLQVHARRNCHGCLVAEVSPSATVTFQGASEAYPRPTGSEGSISFKQGRNGTVNCTEKLLWPVKFAGAAGLDTTARSATDRWLDASQAAHHFGLPFTAWSRVMSHDPPFVPAEKWKPELADSPRGQAAAFGLQELLSGVEALSRMHQTRAHATLQKSASKIVDVPCGIGASVPFYLTRAPLGEFEPGSSFKPGRLGFTAKPMWSIRNSCATALQFAQEGTHERHWFVVPPGEVRVGSWLHAEAAEPEFEPWTAMPGHAQSPLRPGVERRYGRVRATSRRHRFAEQAVTCGLKGRPAMKPASDAGRVPVQRLLRVRPFAGSHQASWSACFSPEIMCGACRKGSVTPRLVACRLSQTSFSPSSPARPHTQPAPRAADRWPCNADSCFFAIDCKADASAGAEFSLDVSGVDLSRTGSCDIPPGLMTIQNASSLPIMFQQTGISPLRDCMELSPGFACSYALAEHLCATPSSCNCSSASQGPEGFIGRVPLEAISLFAIAEVPASFLQSAMTSRVLNTVHVHLGDFDLRQVVEKDVAIGGASQQRLEIKVFPQSDGTICIHVRDMADDLPAELAWVGPARSPACIGSPTSTHQGEVSLMVSVPCVSATVFHAGKKLISAEVKAAHVTFAQFQRQGSGTAAHGRPTPSESSGKLSFTAEAVFATFGHLNQLSSIHIGGPSPALRFACRFCQLGRLTEIKEVDIQPGPTHVMLHGGSFAPLRAAVLALHSPPLTRSFCCPEVTMSGDTFEMAWEAFGGKLCWPGEAWQPLLSLMPPVALAALCSMFPPTLLPSFGSVLHVVCAAHSASEQRGGKELIHMAGAVVHSWSLSVSARALHKVPGVPPLLGHFVPDFTRTRLTMRRVACSNVMGTSQHIAASLADMALSTVTTIPNAASVPLSVDLHILPSLSVDDARSLVQAILNEPGTVPARLAFVSGTIALHAGVRLAYILLAPPLQALLDATGVASSGPCRNVFFPHGLLRRLAGLCVASCHQWREQGSHHECALPGEPRHPRAFLRPKNAPRLDGQLVALIAGKK